MRTNQLRLQLKGFKFYQRKTFLIIRKSLPRELGGDSVCTCTFHRDCPDFYNHVLLDDALMIM